MRQTRDLARVGWRGLAPFLPIGPRGRPRLADSFSRLGQARGASPGSLDQRSEEWPLCEGKSGALDASVRPILQQNSLAQHWARDWRALNLTNSVAQHWARDWLALALTQVHHGSRLSDSCEDGEALSSVHSTALAAGKLIHNLLCDGRVKND